MTLPEHADNFAQIILDAIAASSLKETADRLDFPEETLRGLREDPLAGPNWKTLMRFRIGATDKELLRVARILLNGRLQIEAFPIPAIQQRRLTLIEAERQILISARYVIDRAVHVLSAWQFALPGGVQPPMRLEIEKANDALIISTRHVRPAVYESLRGR